MKAVADFSRLVGGIVEGSGKCEHCGATVRLGNGWCVSCLLKENFAAEVEPSAEVFERVMRETNVPDKQWRLGNYEILEEIGRGGMGVIYRARQRHSGRIVALKRVVTYHADSHETLVRFRREAKAAASLDHPNILPVYEVSETEDGLPFFSMKFATGGSLRTGASGIGGEPRECVRRMAKVARAIQYAHTQGILHRDLQPGNILLDARGEPLVSDFGLAKWLDEESDLTRTLTTFGTPGYIAPEQAEGAHFGPAADIYSLGAILFNLLAGRPPFIGANALSVIQQAAVTSAPKLRPLVPLVDRGLETLVARCLERDPNARYQTAGALAEDLERWLEGRPIVARPVRVTTRVFRWSRRNPILASAGSACLLLALAVIWLLVEKSPAPKTRAPEKSIAVLPFKDLSDNKQNSYFADGVQDEILTDLARIADLKVIGPTSVMKYKSGVARDLRKIGEQLGVAHLVEGTVERSGSRVHVNAGLVDARTNRRSWGQVYDRDLADVFTIENEIATAIADELDAKLLPNEKREIERPTTGDIPAFDLYTRANNLLLAASFRDDDRGHLRQAADLLSQAVARDPAFFQAYCQLAYVHDRLYFDGFDHTPARLALAEAAIQRAFLLRPDAGEAYLARAQNLYWGYLDYDGALAQLEVARQSLPNDARIFQLMGYIQRRQGRWDDSARDLERAVELDPHDLETLHQIATNYDLFRSFTEETLVLNRALAIEPNHTETKVIRANVDLDWKADTQPLHQVIDEIRAENSAGTRRIANNWLLCALAERDAASAKDALIALGETPFTDGSVQWNRPLVEGLIARMMKDDAKAHAAFTAARADQEKIVRAEPNHAPSRCVLGLIDAALGRKDEALREGRRAVELLPIEKDAIRGKAMIRYLAKIAAWAGDNDLACEQLAIATQVPSGVTYGQLKLLPWWDPLRGDPRFEKIVASLAPR
ncbi:MAG TPA: FlgO family outer membrane protein [Candidatus Binatia bacterium]|jgi:serine/threonine protein kinase/Tfp pilus assembly protein PilF